MKIIKVSIEKRETSKAKIYMQSDKLVKVKRKCHKDIESNIISVFPASMPSSF